MVVAVGHAHRLGVACQLGAGHGLYGARRWDGEQVRALTEVIGGEQVNAYAVATAKPMCDTVGTAPSRAPSAAGTVIERTDSLSAIAHRFNTSGQSFGSFAAPGVAVLGQVEGDGQHRGDPTVVQAPGLLGHRSQDGVDLGSAGR